MSTAPIAGVSPDVAAALTAQATPRQAKAGGSQNTATNVPADTRLVIEDDKAAGSYVYVTIDPVTGKVISQIPREQLLRMREASDYTPGSIVNARG